MKVCLMWDWELRVCVTPEKIEKRVSDQSIVGIGGDFGNKVLNEAFTLCIASSLSPLFQSFFFF